MIVITTPTGDIGRQVLADLIDGDEPLRVIVRDPSKLSAEVRERVEVIEGSHADPAVVERAFAGADAVFWLVPPQWDTPDIYAAYVDFSRPGVAAMQAHGVKRVVVVSALGREYGRPAGLVSAAQAMVDLIAAAGLDYRELALPGFMDNMLRQIPALTGAGAHFGTLPGDMKIPLVATRDIAGVAARLLADASWTGQAVRPVLGPEDLSMDELSEVLSEVVGKPIAYRQIPVEALREQTVGRGASEALADGLAEMMVAKGDGMDNLQERTPEFSSPTSFREWAEVVLKPALAGA